MNKAANGARDNGVALIIAGGIGKRLWPESRLSQPKQFLSVIGKESLLQSTYERAARLFGPQGVYLGTREELAARVQEQLPQLPLEHLILEPEGRDTAPCIGLFAAWLLQRRGDIPMVVMPSDHLVGEQDDFYRVIRVALIQAAQNHLVTIGIKPTRPETGYGYLETGPKIAEVGGKPCFQLQRFTEKPSHKKAKEFVERGNFLWNAGMFVWKPSVILAEMEQHIPQLREGLRAIESALGTPGESQRIADVYPQLPKISIDYAVMEKTSRAVAIPGEFAWDDLGNWRTVERVFPKDAEGNIQQGVVTQRECRNCIFLNREPDKLLAAIGVSNVIVVNSPQGLLVLNAEMSQTVKQLLNELMDDEQMRKYVD